MSGVPLARCRALVIVLAGALLLLLAGPASGTPAPRGSRMQALLDELVSEGAPSAAAAIDDGTGARLVASGAARLVPRLPMRPGAQVRVGSTTKTFVSTVALQLVGEGRLRLDDSVDRWLPGVVPGGGRITVRELLNHTSGLFNYTEDPGFLAQLSAAPRQYRTPRSLVDAATAHPPLFAPGHGWSYSNTNFVLVGLILERATGQDLGRLLQDRILGPLHLSGTSFPGRTWRLGGYYAHGYLPPSLSGTGYVDFTDVNASWAWAAGALVSTVDDLSTFYRALLSGRLLRPAQLAAMQNTIDVSPVLRYGLGLYSLRTPCGTVWGHDGSVPGYQSVAYTDPQGRRSVALALPVQLLYGVGGDERLLALWDLTVQTAVCEMYGRLPDGTSGTARLDRPLGLATG